MFSTKEFIDASRAFVCVRLESFESKENQDMVRKFLNGRFENTAFCILAPDGKTRLSGTGRSPQMGFGIRGRPEAGGPEAKAQNALVIESMEKIAKKYPTKADSASAVVEDFNSFKQSLNVSSGDQRLLVFVVAPEKQRNSLKKDLQVVANHQDVLGRFHFDFADNTDAKWSDVIDGDQSKTGIFVIHPGEFGQKGKVMAELPLTSEAKTIRETLAKANKAYAASETRKVYSEHVQKGRKEGVKYEDNMPWGEDRDADGKIDERPARRGQRGERRGPLRR
ncbi:hypothetical protein NT6N_25030 [Oceaniferula spumae]|uniref:Uncharacterized protein n=1 Tax=Oceaniferula spumae TaxID=2979115 RepID=A0AAT9FNB2_9BACT